MERECVVFGCRNSTILFQAKKNDCNFFNFPLHEPVLVNRWLEKLCLEGWSPGPENVVCEEHFSFDSFEVINNKRVLKHDAVPNIIDDLQRIIAFNETVFAETQGENDENEVKDLRCRICARFLSSKDAVHIHSKDENVIDKMMACIPILVKEEDFLPKHICRVCLTDLNISYRMLVRAIESEKLFNNLIKCQDKLDSNENDDSLKETDTEKESKPECVICNIEFEDLDALSLHFQNSHVDEFEFSIEHKDKSADSEGSFIQFVEVGHLKNGDDEGGDETHIETIMDVDHSAEERAVGVASKSKNTKWLCTVCNMCFTSKDILDFHVENFHKSCVTSNEEMEDSDVESVETNGTDQDPPYLMCTFCARFFNSIDDLNEHLESHMESFVCDICGYSCRNREEMEKHNAEEHAKKTKTPCPVCCVVFPSYAEMSQHSQEVHQLKNVNEDNVAQKWVCKFCGKEIGSKLSLSIHERIHTGVRPFVCECCGRSFKSKANLIQHQPVHTGVKRYKCSICDKPFARKAFVTTHMRVHTGERPFKCEICGNRYTQIGDMRRHKKRHTAVEAANAMKETAEESELDGDVVSNGGGTGGGANAGAGVVGGVVALDDTKLISVEQSGEFFDSGLIKLHFAKDVTDFRRILVELQQ